MNNLINVRLLAVATGVLCIASLLIAYFFMEKHLLLQPCPLCILDRMVVGVIGVGCFAIAVLPPQKYRWQLAAAAVNGVALALGFIFAGRHIWLQNRPIDESLACLSNNATVSSFTDLIAQAFDAKADCGSIAWELWGLSIPEQVLLLFVVLFVLQTAMVTKIITARRVASTA